METRFRLFLGAMVFLLSALVMLAWVAPAGRRADDGARALLVFSQQAMTRARRLDQTLLLSGKAQKEAFAQLHATTHRAPVRQALDALEECLSLRCPEQPELALQAKFVLAEQLGERRDHWAALRQARRKREYQVVGSLVVGGLVMLGFCCRPLPTSSEPSEPSPESNLALEQTLRDRLEQLYKVRKRSRDNARFAAFGEVAAGLSHGLKTPLACVRAATQVAQAKLAPDHPAQRNLDNVIDEVDGLVEQIVRFLKTMSGGAPVLEEHDPRTVLALLDERYRHGLADKRVSWSMEIDDSVQSVYVELELVEMALRNLVDNAFAASGVDSRVVLSVRHCEAPSRVGIDAEVPAKEQRGLDWIEISVLDEGPGISPKLVHREKVNSTRPGGSGLGIAIARRIAARMGGVLELSPRAGGQGMRASFYLPPFIPPHGAKETPENT